MYTGDFLRSIVFPARAGMSRSGTHCPGLPTVYYFKTSPGGIPAPRISLQDFPACIPRMCWDEPYPSVWVDGINAFSPFARG